jgi:2-deoxy-scyllo-inosamine dehydrogenase (SAM-dependent)/8-amino-3,8-dideoxy-alpha-D-manno-octulosonate transaminase
MSIPLFERLQIESQSNCNRACWFCPRTYDRSGKYLQPNGDAVINRMATETILGVLEQAQALGFSGEVGFHHYSEPLLDPRNVSLAAAARARGMRPYLHTNGDLLKADPALRREVGDVYERIVIGLYDYTSRAELDDIKRFWRDCFSGTPLEFSPIGRFGIGSGDSVGIPRAWVPTDRRMATPDMTFDNAPCHRPMIRLIVQHDGEMANCCEDTHGDFDLGNIHTQSLAALWYSPRHVAVVTDLMAGRRSEYKVCRNCPLPPTGPAEHGSKIRILPRVYRLRTASAS